MNWTIGRTILAIVALSFTVIFAGGASATLAMQEVVEAKDDVSDVHGRNSLMVSNLLEHVESERAAWLTVLLGDPRGEVERLEERGERHTLVGEIERSLRAESEHHAGDGTALVAEAGSLRAFDEATSSLRTWEAATDAVLSQSKADPTADRIALIQANGVEGSYDALHKALLALESDQQEALARQSAEATSLSVWANRVVVGGCFGAALLVGVLATWLSTSLNRRVTAAIQHVQSASAELQSSATQQAAATKEQISTVTEVANTFNELHSTTRQIADSAQRVAGIAHETAAAATDGNETVNRGRDAVGNIKNEVEVVVHYMLDLGRKSQQIGGILEMINELSEQTNILAINASIEAAGAGEAGARFGVVADEIRKLADRVGGSTKEIRALIDEIRASVNTTVMATESGSKAVDTGVQKFGEVTVVFGSIGRGIGVVSEAAREIELGTRQQATAVDQVGVALTGLQQVARETESATHQTAQTAQQLVVLARDLHLLVNPRNS